MGVARSLINSVPAFTYLLTLRCQTVSSPSLHFPYLESRDRFLHPSGTSIDFIFLPFILLFLILFLSFASRRNVENRSDSQDSIGSDFRKDTNARSLIQSRNIVPWTLKHMISVGKFSEIIVEHSPGAGVALAALWYFDMKCNIKI